MFRQLVFPTLLYLALAAKALGATLTVNISGAGTVSPNLAGQDLLLGKMYTLTAKPAAGNLFSNWSGSLTGRTATLSFVMQENLTLQANFVTNPFTARKGTYTGLYSVPDAPGTVAGGFTLTATDQGKFTGSLQFGAKKVGLLGQFGLSGTASGTILLPPNLLAFLTLDLFATNGLTGSLSLGSAVAVLRANRAGFDSTHPTLSAGKYTMIFPGSADGGDGYASVTIDALGKIKSTGKLADGTAFTQNAVLASDGSWPFFVSLYGGKGMAWGWLALTNREQSDFDGLVTWIRPGGTGGTVASNAVGSRYTPPSGRVLDFEEGWVSLAGGGLPGPYAAAITLASNNQVIDNLATNGPATRLRMQIKTTSGIFTGSLVPPALLRPVKFQGAVFQKGNYGSGFFLNGTNNGHLLVSPAPGF